MTNEEKIINQEEQKTCECKTCKCCELLKKFLFITGAIYLGTLSALVTSHALFKPKFPPRGMFMPQPGIERPMFNHHKMMKHHKDGFNETKTPKFEKPIQE